jgi:hypothetical protein
MVLRRPYGKKKKLKTLLWLSPHHRAVEGFPLTNKGPGGTLYEESELELCDGDIVATVKAVDEPDWGSTFARLEIVYQCNKCGCTAFNELPQSEEALSRWLTESIAAMTDEQRNAIFARQLEEKAANEKQRQVMLNKLEKGRKVKK